LEGLSVTIKDSDYTTTFRNLSDGVSRSQFLYEIAEPITKEDIPVFRMQPKIVHLGPVADEVDPDILSLFPGSMKCLTPQGWFRSRNAENQVVLQPWQEFEQVLPQADAAVISLEDVQKDEESIVKMAAAIPVFVVTENYKGARVYWHNDVRFFSAPEVKYVDDTGAGDIFSAAFFYQYHFTKDPWEAGRFAVLLASWSVTRSYLDSIPTKEEIEKAKMELLSY
jgi:sugar/nucleoside kinase (ribokinase family)